MYYPQVEKKYMQQFYSLVRKSNRETFVYALLFLFPIFAVTARHWVSGFFGLLALTSLFMLFKKEREKFELLKEEKVLLWGFAFFFAVFILTSLVNGWGPLQTRYAGVEIRYLLFIPIYLMVRRMDNAAVYLISGCVIGVIYTGFDAIKAIEFSNQPVYTGPYSQLFAGPITLLLAGLSLPYFYLKCEKIWQKGILLLALCLALYAVAHTGARNAYMAAIVIGVLYILVYSKGPRRYASLVIMLSLIFMAYHTNTTINERVNMAYSEFVEYFSYQDPAKHTGSLSSTGTRLEMWRSTPVFMADSPLFGVGRGNYTAEVKKYAAEGVLHADIAQHGHPHNAYSEMIISKGLIGLVAFFWILIYPLTKFAQGKNTNSQSAILGIILITTYMVLSLTDASTFIKRNYSSIYIVFLAVLYSHYIREKIKLKISPE